MKWISVKDRLPNGERCLVLLKNSHHSAKKYSIEIATVYGGKFYLYVSYRDGANGDLMTVPYRIDGVAHWMPLPEPPKELGL